MNQKFDVKCKRTSLFASIILQIGDFFTLKPQPKVINNLDNAINDLMFLYSD